MNINPHRLAEGERVGDEPPSPPGVEPSCTDRSSVTREDPSFAHGLAASTTRLALQEIHLWQRPLRLGANEGERLHALLSLDEQQRAQRLHLEQDRRAFVAVRGTLRLLLGHYGQQPPARLRFRYSQEGKPFLEGEGPSLAFNVTHSGEWALFAISREGDVGIDLEQVRPITPERCLRLARRFFSSREADALEALPVGTIHAAFFACWTRKEAYIKCRGGTLAHLLAQCVVNVDPDQPASLLASPWQGDAQGHCQLHDLPAATGYRAALALASPLPFTLCHHPWGAKG
ncbi:MAG: 4'-phosphopantetheinyl transferase superfamily protein [Magnetococcus sp. XQGC-1]